MAPRNTSEGATVIAWIFIAVVVSMVLWGAIIAMILFTRAAC